MFARNVLRSLPVATQTTHLRCMALALPQRGFSSKSPKIGGLVAEITSPDALKHIAWMEKAFGNHMSVYVMNKTKDDKKVAHAQILINGSMLYICDKNTPEAQKLGTDAIAGVCCNLNIDRNADEWFKNAVAAGAEVKMEMQDMFWGARYGKVLDPFGLRWSFHETKRKQHHNHPKH